MIINYILNLLNEPFASLIIFIEYETVTSVRSCLSYDLLFYRLQSLCISMKNCIVVTDVVMALLVPAKVLQRELVAVTIRGSVPFYSVAA